MPYSKPLEDIAYPHEPQIVGAVLETLGIAAAGGGSAPGAPGRAGRPVR
jgi:hypothetical protein